MLYLFWTILNSGLAILFIIVCFQATKLVRQKLGLLAAIFFVFGLFSFINKPTDQLESESDKHKWNWRSDNKDDSLVYRNIQHKKIIVEKNMMFKINIGVQYYMKENSNQVVPISAFSTPEGTFSGYEWKPTSISIQIAENGRDLEYDVSGTIESKLLGSTVHYNYKNYSGIIKGE